MQFLQLLDYNVCVSAAVYTEWYFKLCDLCERNSARRHAESAVLVAPQLFALASWDGLFRLSVALRTRDEPLRRAGPVRGCTEVARPKSPSLRAFNAQVRLKPLDSAEAARLEICSDMHSTRLRSDFMTRSGVHI